MPRKRSRLNWLRYTIAVTFCVGFGALLAWPAFESLWTASDSEDFISRQNRLDQIQWVQTILVAGFLYTWFFFFGATVGSFLNVVIWRMPRGETVVTRPSRCPWCSTNLKWNDNIPVLGWLMLGGRCRTCRIPISPRYPIVEALMGTVFLLLLQFELLSGGGNLPGIEAVHLTYARMMLELKLNLLGYYAFHCFLFCLLICWSLIAWDRQRMPTTLTILAFGVGFFGPLVWPNLYPVKAAWAADQPGYASPVLVSVFETAIMGVLVGTLLGLAMRFFAPATTSDDHSGRWGVPIMMGAVGLFFGWEAALVISVLAVALTILLWPIWKKCQRADLAGGLELSIFGMALIHLLTWKFWNAYFEGHWLVTVAVFAGLLLLLGLLLKRLTWRPSVDLDRFRLPPAASTTP